MTTASFLSEKLITSYNFPKGRVLARKYEVVSHVGRGAEGELYMLHELPTGIERTAKFFFPQCNKGNRIANYYARKLHKLRHCNILMQYRTQETISYAGMPVTFLVSDFIQGRLLKDLIAEAPGRKLPAFEAMHLFHSLVRGVEEMHKAGEYHGHLSMDNIIVKRYGLSFQIKLMDLSHFGSSRPEIMREDIFQLVNTFFEMIGGARHYAKQPAAVKELCLNMKRALIIDKFRNAGQLKNYIETIDWS